MDISSRQKNIARRVSIVFCIAVIGTFIASPAYAQQFVPLAGIPGLTTEVQGIGDYLNALFVLTISLGALLAVVKIALAGTKWAMSDVVTDKSDAKKDIQGAILGLLILLASFVVLNFINPNLTSLNILGKLRPIDLPDRNPPSTQQARTAQEVRELSKSCGGRNPGTVISTNEGSCCRGGNVPKNECSTTVEPKIDPRTGINTSVVYEQSELIDLQNKIKSDSNLFYFGDTTNLSQEEIAAGCERQLQGSSPLKINIRTRVNGVADVGDAAVCVK